MATCFTIFFSNPQRLAPPPPLSFAHRILGSQFRRLPPWRYAATCQDPVLSTSHNGREGCLLYPNESADVDLPSFSIRLASLILTMARSVLIHSVSHLSLQLRLSSPRGATPYGYLCSPPNAQLGTSGFISSRSILLPIDHFPPQFKAVPYTWPRSMAFCVVPRAIIRYSLLPFAPFFFCFLGRLVGKPQSA